MLCLTALIPKIENDGFRETPIYGKSVLTEVSRKSEFNCTILEIKLIFLLPRFAKSELQCLH